MNASTSPDASETETPELPAVSPTEGTSRLHGRCPHCHEIVIAHMATASARCSACTQSFLLLEILPLTVYVETTHVS